MDHAGAYCSREEKRRLIPARSGDRCCRDTMRYNKPAILVHCSDCQVPGTVSPIRNLSIRSKRDPLIIVAVIFLSRTNGMKNGSTTSVIIGFFTCLIRLPFSTIPSTDFESMRSSPRKSATQAAIELRIHPTNEAMDRAGAYCSREEKRPADPGPSGVLLP